MDSIKIAEFSYDLHNSLGEYETPELENLKLLGMAATLSVHIRGLGEINYDVLKSVSYHYFKIPSFALNAVIDVLDELDFIDVMGSKRKITSIIPKIPPFENIYQLVGESLQPGELNECEEVMLSLLNCIYNKPENKNNLLQKINASTSAIDTCYGYCEEGGLIRTHKARGKEIVISPYYFADNLEGLADLTAKSGARRIHGVLEKLKANQGWPLSLMMSQHEIGGKSLDATELSLLQKMSSEGILKPPSIKFDKDKSERFIFTPSPGNKRLSISNREIYEKSMALISCVRKGQLLPNKYKINYPKALLRSFRDKKYLNSNSEAITQYRNLVYLKVAILVPVTSDRYQLHLIQTPENVRALDLAINLLETGDLASLEVNQEARIAFSKDESYIQSLISASEMRKLKKFKASEEASHEMDKLLLNIDL